MWILALQGYQNQAPDDEVVVTVPCLNIHERTDILIHYCPMRLTHTASMNYVWNAHVKTFIREQIYLLIIAPVLATSLCNKLACQVPGYVTSW